jgi:hypothetical protein
VTAAGPQVDPVAQARAEMAAAAVLLVHARYGFWGAIDRYVEARNAAGPRPPVGDEGP